MFLKRCNIKVSIVLGGESMNKKDLKAVFLASALCGVAAVAPVMADEVEQDPVDIQDQVLDTSNDSDVVENTETSADVTENLESDSVVEQGSDLYKIETTTVVSQEEAQKDGWESGNQRYYENGELVTNQLKEIDGNTYYFGSSGYKKSGYVTVDGDNYFFDNNGAMKKNYYDGLGYFGEDGRQIYNQWQYVDGYGWMYFYESGYHYTAYGEGYASYAIDGETYLFDSQGVMQTNKEFGDRYYSENGKAVCDEWIKFPEGYRYYNINGCYYAGGPDGEGNMYLAFREIDGKTYAFDLNGYMVTGWVHQWNDWYYFNTDGSMATNQWIDDTFYVNEDGSMVTDEWIDDSNYVDENGKKTKNSWELVDGKWQYKFGDGNYANGMMLRIDGKYYAFDYQGYMVTDSTTWVSSNDTDEYGYVHANASGELITGWNKEKDGTWKYYGDDYFALQSGLYTINGNLYAFNDYVMIQDTKFVYDGKLYQANASGITTLVDTTGKTGWEKLGYIWYYFENGTAVQDELKTIGDKTYYFYKDGSMTSSQTFEYNNKYYYANADGVVIDKKDSWYQTENGDWIYIKPDGSLVMYDFYTINNSTYYFGYSGHLQKGVISTDDGRYVTDSNGAIQFGKGWKYCNFEWYYAKNNGTLYTLSFVTDNGKTYYFNSNGAMVNSDVLKIDDKYYCFDTNGVLQQTIEPFTGWKLIDNQWYYSDDGNMEYCGKVGNNYVLYGKMAINCVIDGKYYYDYNGEIQKGWIQYNSSWLYADPVTGELVKDKWVNVDGNWYYFSHIYMMQCNSFVDGAYNKFDSNGVWQGAVEPNSWVYEGGTDTWQYINEKGLLNDKRTLTINGVTYYFNAFGYGSVGGYCGLVQNGTWYDPRTLDRYWINQSGTGFDTTTGWKKSKNGYWGYVENGKAVIGLKTIGGKEYYFNFDGYLYPGALNVNGKAYVTDSNGNVVKYSEGWNELEGQWFYIKNGTALTYTVVDGYYVGYDGLTYTGQVRLDDTSSPVVLIQGQLARNQWVEDQGEWHYGDENGNAVRNKWIGDYYFDENGMMVKNAWIGNYHVGADGKWDLTR